MYIFVSDKSSWVFNKNNKINFITVNTDAFNDGESCVRMKEYPDFDKNRDACIVHNLYPKPNDRLMELLMMIDCVKRAGARYVVIFVPYFCYARQDRITKDSFAVSARLVCDLFVTAGVDKVITCDIHSECIGAFFSKQNFVNLKSDSFFIDHIKQTVKNLENIVVVAPDAGGVKRSKEFADILNSTWVAVNKSRSSPGQISELRLFGDVKNRDCVLVDDIIDSAGTACRIADLLKKEGAKSIIMYVTHPILTGNAIEKIENSFIDVLYIADTIVQKISSDKIKTIPIVNKILQSFFVA